MTKPADSPENRFEDEFIRIEFTIDRQRLAFTLLNKTDNPIKIRWNEAAYVDASNQSHKVMHSGIGYSQRNSELPPTLVAPSAEIIDVVVPVDYVNWLRWSVFKQPRIVADYFPKPDSKEGASFDGKSFRVFMPVEIGGSITNYQFTFSIMITEAAAKPVSPAANASYGADTKMTTDGVVAKHLEAIGSAEARATVRTRAVSGPLRYVSRTQAGGYGRQGDYSFGRAESPPDLPVSGVHLLGGAVGL
ncbi:MAG TPA: hypothetical protein VJH03_16625 [Blastocatellia bacterium]|nr:hypothetical protein [Blastocatellia bacterium]